MFLLGFFSGIIVLLAILCGFYYVGKRARVERTAVQQLKDELLLKSLPVYQQALTILNTDEIDPKKLASLLFIATLVENELDDILLKSPSDRVN
jgi:hypothetical protein